MKLSKADYPEHNAKMTRRQSERARAAIQTSRLLQLLQKHALGLAEMSTSQIRAAEIILRKTLPDMKSLEVAAEVEQKVEYTKEELEAQLRAYGVDPAIVVKSVLN